MPERVDDYAALSDFLAPFDSRTFLAEYWEQRPLLIQAAESFRHQRLFSLKHADRILTNATNFSSQVAVVREGTRIPTPVFGHKVATLEAVYDAFRQGATIILNGVHGEAGPLADLCRDLAHEFSAAFQANAYITPAIEQGLSTHYDTHDVFVLQVSGTKHWRLYDSPVILPTGGQPFARDATQASQLQQEFDLNPGDRLYLPRGVLHDATSCGSTSLHLTIGVSTVTWASVFRQALESCIDREPRLRASLRPGFARVDSQDALEAQFRDMLEVIHERIDPASALNGAAQGAKLGASASPEGRLLDVEAEARIDPNTRLRRRHSVHAEVRSEAGHLILHFESKLVRVPAFLEPEIHFLLAADHEFIVSDLPGSVDEAGALILVRRLVREGLLSICRTEGH